MEKSDMKPCHRFLQDTELVPFTKFLRVKSLVTVCFKTAWGSNWFHTSDGSVHSLDPMFTCLLARCQYLFLKNMWSIKNPGHMQIIYFADETHLTHQKSDPSDADSPGHPTHFQSWSHWCKVLLTKLSILVALFTIAWIWWDHVMELCNLTRIDKHIMLIHNSEGLLIN